MGAAMCPCLPRLDNLRRVTILILTRTGGHPRLGYTERNDMRLYIADRSMTTTTSRIQGMFIAHP
jgi:hypothetical protein